MTFVPFLVGIFIDNIWLMLSMLPLTCGLVIRYLVLNGQRYDVLHKAADRLKQVDIDHLQGQYNAKKAAIERTRQIANS
jgi:hypothetical protein